MRVGFTTLAPGAYLAQARQTRYGRLEANGLYDLRSAKALFDELSTTIMPDAGNPVAVDAFNKAHNQLAALIDIQSNRLMGVKFMTDFLSPQGTQGRNYLQALNPIKEQAQRNAAQLLSAVQLSPAVFKEPSPVTRATRRLALISEWVAGKFDPAQDLDQIGYQRPNSQS